MLSGIPESAICVQKFDDSLNSAIHITYRNSLRSSSLREPRDPLSKVVFIFKNAFQLRIAWRHIKIHKHKCGQIYMNHKDFHLYSSLAATP